MWFDLSEIFSEPSEWHYFLCGLAVGWTGGWLIHAWINRRGYDLRVRNWFTKRKFNKLSKCYKG